MSRKHTNNNAAGKFILYGVFISFIGTIAMCIITLIVLVNTVHLANQLYAKNEELCKAFDGYVTRINTVEQSIVAAKDSIDENTDRLSGTIEKQTELVTDIYSNMTTGQLVSDDNQVKTDDGPINSSTGDPIY